MMGIVREWLLSVVVISMLVSLVERLMPQGSLQTIAHFIGGLLLLLTVLNPVLEAGGVDFTLDLEPYRQEIASVQAELTANQEESLKRRIKEDTQAYILEKATALGLTCQADVMLDDGLAPVAVTMDIPYHEALSQYIAQTLGVGEEGQTWDETA